MMKKHRWGLVAALLSATLCAEAAFGSFGAGPTFIGEIPLDRYVAGIHDDEIRYEKDIIPGAALSAALTSLPRRAALPMNLIMQYPELPTGCESVSLTMALNTIGFSLGKTEIAENYLLYSEDDLAQGYNGDPWAEDGAGIFPPGLVMTANAFLKEKGSSYRAYEGTGCSLRRLLAYVAAGYPVCLWVTMEYDEPMWSDDYDEFDGTYYEWYWNEHCVAIGGYDLVDNYVEVYDPLSGYLQIEIDYLEELTEEIGGLSLILYK